MANYELMLILSSSISDDDRNASLDELKALFKKNDVKIEKEDVWGEKKLAYKINKSETGYYILMDLDLEGKKIKDLSKVMNLNKPIWRYMFTKKDS